MKIILDCIVEEKGRYIAYIKLQDAESKTLATAAIPYVEGQTEVLKTLAINKFKSKAIEQINKESKIADIMNSLGAALLEIDVEKEVVK